MVSRLETATVEALYTGGKVMNIVVAEVGKAGHALVRQLDAEGHDVTVIESKSQVLEQTPDYLDVVGLQGSGTDVDVLREARAVKANLVIAATSTDETNIVICLLGRGLKEVMIVGGLRIAAYLATRLLDMNIAVKIIEKNLDKALDHALRFPDVTVICGDGTDQATLLSENLDGMDGFVSLTDNDEENVIISMFAEQQSVEHVVPKVNRVELGFLLENRASPMPCTEEHSGRQNRSVCTCDAELCGFQRRIHYSRRRRPDGSAGVPRGVQLPVHRQTGEGSASEKRYSGRFYHTQIPSYGYPGNTCVKQGDSLIAVSKVKGLRNINDVLIAPNGKETELAGHSAGSGIRGSF